RLALAEPLDLPGHTLAQFHHRHCADEGLDGLGEIQRQLGRHFQLDAVAADAFLLAHFFSTKAASTFLVPALSNSISSLSPSTLRTVPMPNFWWNTRLPRAMPSAFG